MADRDITVADCDIMLLGGNLITLHNSKEYVYGCSMTVDNWEQIKTAVDKLISERNKGGENNDG